ncbi:MAG: hypothetical protein IPG17_29080 [Sandaracinaceae bacterium]|nr:hypothetical protein [Sandaracinaceae bacterium]
MRVAVGRVDHTARVRATDWIADWRTAAGTVVNEAGVAFAHMHATIGGVDDATRVRGAARLARRDTHRVGAIVVGDEFEPIRADAGRGHAVVLDIADATGATIGRDAGRGLDAEEPVVGDRDRLAENVDERP